MLGDFEDGRLSRRAQCTGAGHLQWAHPHTRTHAVSTGTLVDRTQRYLYPLAEPTPPARPDASTAPGSCGRGLAGPHWENKASPHLISTSTPNANSLHVLALFSPTIDAGLLHLLPPLTLHFQSPNCDFVRAVSLCAWSKIWGSFRFSPLPLRPSWSLFPSTHSERPRPGETHSPSHPLPPMIHSSPIPRAQLRHLRDSLPPLLSRLSYYRACFPSSYAAVVDISNRS